MAILDFKETVKRLTNTRPVVRSRHCRPVVVRERTVQQAVDLAEHDVAAGRLVPHAEVVALLEKYSGDE